VRPGPTENLLQLQVNGERREVVDNLSLQGLITQLNLPSERIAIELNREVVRRSAWAATILSEDDRVEIVHFVGGGLEGSRQ
jgi:thiamine biosynthesis protein ThiS